MRLGTAAAALGLLLAGCSGRPPLEADIVVKNVTVIDGTDGPSRPDQSVAISGDKIVAIQPAAELTVPTGAVVVEGRGKYLIPGLWDMHVHLFGYEEHSFPLFLANGVTAIRDLSGPLARSLWLRQETRYGRLLGPEMLISGPTLDADYVVRALVGTPYAAAREAVPDSAAAVKIVDSLTRVSVDQIKVHSMTPRTGYFAVLKEAKRRGVFVVGHVPDSVTMKEAIEAGQRTIEHDTQIEEAESSRGAEINRWMLAAMQRVINKTTAKPNIGAIFPLRLAAGDSALRSFDPKIAAELGAFAAKHEVWFDPTLVVTEAFFRADEPAIRNPPELKYAPKAALAMTEGIVPKSSPTAAQIEEGRRKWRTYLTTIPPLIKAGAKLVTGTDVPVVPLVPGFSLLRELELLVEAGLTPKQALQAGTRNSAAAAGKLGEAGTIEVGKSASLVLLDADPLANISNAKRIRAVIVRGKLLDRATLDRMLVDAEVYAKGR